MTGTELDLVTEYLITMVPDIIHKTSSREERTIRMWGTEVLNSLLSTLLLPQMVIMITIVKGNKENP